MLEDSEVVECSASAEEQLNMENGVESVGEGYTSEQDISTDVGQVLTDGEEKLVQLLTELQALKNEQVQLKNDHAQWTAAVQERDILKEQVAELRRALVKTEEDWHDRLCKQKTEYVFRLEKAQRERDSMVVKYALSEKEVIGLKNVHDNVEKKMRDLAKERDVLMEKIKGLNNEKSRVCTMLDAKCNELLSAQREIERMKEEVNAREIKLRWSQNKLKNEGDSHKETQVKLDKSLQQAKQLKDELEDVKRNYHELKSKESSAAKTMSEEQLLEEKAKLIIEKGVLEEQSTVYRNALKEFEIMKTRHTLLVEENRDLGAKLLTAQKDKCEQEQDANRFKEQVQQQRQAILELQTKLAEMDGVQIQLERERERMSKNQDEMEDMKQLNATMEQEMQRCRQKEVELLEFTQKLTEINVQLQSDFTSLDEKATLMEKERLILTKRFEEVDYQLKSCQLELREEAENRKAENLVWSRSLSEKSTVCEDLQTQVRELQNELNSVKRKHAVNMKELNRELRLAKKRLDNADLPCTAIKAMQGNDAASLGSRTSSSTSLNTTGLEHHSPDQSPSPTQVSPNIHGADWERNALMDKMVRIQRDNAKKNDKIDFLEEHVQDLVCELQKKNRLLQLYFVKEESGILASEASDKHKAELAKHGGIMSSMYNVKMLDEGLNLDLCLEINQKLQSVLEDTLLKNITLKENLSTLGAEVARITQQYQSLLKQK